MGQDCLLHVGATHEASRAAALASEQVCSAAPGVRIRNGRVAVGVF